MDGKLTVWCAQHGMDDYKPKTGREYELPSKSGQESMLIIAFLISRPQTPDIAQAVKAGIDWYNDPEVYVKDKIYVRPEMGDDRKAEVFVDAPGRKMWYRFYELETNRGFFCDKGSGGKKLYDYQQLKDDRYYGYVWAGSWGEPLLAYARKIGIIEGLSTGIKRRR
jgi:PelA/Pel-15E family pectate lyase